MEYRIENKYLVSELEIAAISQRLKTVMQPDVHQEGAHYEIRSIYFDDIYDSGFLDNENGVNDRKKYRIRSYGPAPSAINLEIKEKMNALTRKTKCGLDQDEYAGLLEDACLMPFGQKAPLNELLLHARTRRLKPCALIVYERTAFVHPVGNVRITFDKNIMATSDFETFRDARVEGLIPVLPAGMHILEVKYDELLPDFIAKQLEIRTLQQTAFSKFYYGRCALAGSLY